MNPTERKTREFFVIGSDCQVDGPITGLEGSPEGNWYFPKLGVTVDEGVYCFSSRHDAQLAACEHAEVILASLSERRNRILRALPAQRRLIRSSVK